MESNTKEKPEFTAGHKLLHAVERMVESPEAIENLVRAYWRESSSMQVLCDRIVSHYSNRSAVAGGATALPGMLPGLGTLTVALGSTMVEMVAVLKLEVEMCLALSYAHGFDIRDPRERQLAFLLAAVQADAVASGRNVLLDAGGVSWTAIVNYTPREVEKELLRIFGVFAIAYAAQRFAKGIARSLPFVGIGIGAGFNKVMTTRVGTRARAWLYWRASARQSAHQSNRCDTHARE